MNFLTSIVLALLICLTGNVSATVRSGTHNSVNQLGTLSPGGPVVVSGSLSKEAQALTLSGAAVPLSGGRSFRKEVSVTPGLNRFPIVVTQANGTVTSKFIEMQVESGVAMIHTYDLNGNLESVAPQATPAQPLRSYKWDAADRLIEINRYLPDGVIEKTANTNNGMGERVGKSEFINGVQQSSVAYLYGATGVLQERSANGATVRKTYTGEGEMDYTTATPTPRFYTRDQLGSVREVLDSNGALLAKYDYTPYGVRSRTAGTYETEKGYTGHDYHSASGTVLIRYRAYDPQTARWPSRDPIGEKGGVNLYGFVQNNGVAKIDYLGKLEIAGGVGVDGTIVPAPGIHINVEVSQTIHFISGWPPSIKICSNVSLTVGFTPGAFIGGGINFPVGFSPDNSLEGGATSTTYTAGVGDGSSITAGVSLNDKNSNITASGSGVGPGLGFGGYAGGGKTFSGTSCFSVSCFIDPLNYASDTIRTTIEATKQAYSEAHNWAGNL